MLVTYFFDTRFPHPDHEHCLMALKYFALNEGNEFETVDVAFWSVSSLKACIESFGLTSFPMVCAEGKILCYDLVKTSSELSILLQTLPVLPCLNDSLLLYS